MLPPHRPQNARARSPRDILKRNRASGTDAKLLARMALGNIRLRLKRPLAALKPALRIIEVARD